MEEAKHIIYLLNKTKNLIDLKKVFYLHRYLGKSLIEISTELGYDYGYILNVSSNDNKKMML